MKLIGRWTAVAGLALLVASLSTKGCVLFQESPVVMPELTVDLVWPNPPEVPRIRYVGSIATPRDLGITKSVWRRIREFFVGEMEEKVIKPYGIQTGHDGKIYVVDSVARAIHVFDPERKSYRKFGDPQQLKFPIDIAIDGQGRIFISDAERMRVLKYDSGGNFMGEIGRAGDLKRPAGLVYNPVTGLVYVVDVSGHEIVAYDADGTVRHRFGRRGEDDGEFNFPTNIAVDSKGLLYVTDSLNFRIQVFDPGGKFISRFGRPGDALGYFSKPKGIGLDSEGHIYVVEGLYDTILIFDQQGRLLLNFGGPGIGPGQFWLATGIFIDPQDRIYVADSYNNRIQIFQYLKAAGTDGQQR